MPAPALRIPVTVDLSQFNSAMSEASSRVQQEASNIEGHFNTINQAAGTMALALTAAGGVVVTALLSTVTSLAKIGDLSEELRLPVNLIQALSVAATEARVPAALLTSALEQFTKVSKQGGTDAEKFEKALGNVGASFLQAFKDAGSQEDRLKIISNAIKSTTDEVKRAQLSLQAFGSENTRLIGVLGGGASAFDAYRTKAAELGLEINESMVKSAQEAKSQLLLLSRVLTDEFTSAVGDLIPLLTKLMPLINALAVVARVVGGVFATDSTATIRQMRNELEGQINLWVDLKNRQDALANGVQPKQFREFFGLPNNIPLAEEQASVDNKIAIAQERIETLKKMIASKEAELPPPDKPAFEGREPLKTGTRDRFDSAVEGIEKRTAALDAETATINDGTAAREKAKIAAQLLTVAEQINKEEKINGGKATAEQIAVIDKFSAAYGRAAAAIEQARSPLATFARESANVGRQLNQFAATSLDTMTNELANIVTGTKSAADAFRSMAQSILSDLARIAIRKGITGPIAEGLFGSLGGVGGLFGVGGGAGSAPLIYAPGNAAGTDNWRGGMTWVGENGPELLNLPRGSQIIPNNVARSAGAGGGSMDINVSIDLTGANGDETIERISAQAAARGVQHGLAQYDSALPGRLRTIRTRAL